MPPNVARTPEENVDNSGHIPIKSNNPNLVIHRSLNPWGRHMKYLKTTL